MSYSFNPPPNWPKPPEGWTPSPGWQPDPAWGPAPEGWNFWLDENGNPPGHPGQNEQPQNGSQTTAAQREAQHQEASGAVAPDAATGADHDAARHAPGQQEPGQHEPGQHAATSSAAESSTPERGQAGPGQTGHDQAEPGKDQHQDEQLSARRRDQDGPGSALSGSSGGSTAAGSTAAGAAGVGAAGAVGTAAAGAAGSGQHDQNSHEQHGVPGPGPNPEHAQQGWGTAPGTGQPGQPGQPGQQNAPVQNGAAPGGPNYWNNGGGNGGNWNGGQGFGPNGGQPPKKKGFFSSTIGIVVAIVGTLLILGLVILLAFLAIGLFAGDDKDDAGKNDAASQSQAASSPAEESSAPEDAPSSAAPTATEATGQGPTGKRPDLGTTPDREKPVAEFKGSGDQRLKVDDLDPSKPYYVEYWYQGDSNFSLWGISSEDGMDTDLLANQIDTTAGSHWVDLEGFQQKLDGLHVNGGTDGKWEVKIFDKGFPNTDGKEKISSRSSQAFVYTGKKTKMSVDFTGKEDDMNIQVFNQKGEQVTRQSIGPGNSGTVSLPDASTEDKYLLVQIETTHMDGKWTLDFGKK